MRVATLRVLAFAAWPLVASMARADAVLPTATSDPAAESLDVFSRGLRAYHVALLARRLGKAELRREDLAARVQEAEQLLASGRVDEAVARLGDVIAHPQFELFAQTPEAYAALFRFGDALAAAGVFEASRAALRRVVESPKVWERTSPGNVWARRSVRTLVDLALESGELAGVAGDLRRVPKNAPEEVLGEMAYLSGRASEATGDPEGAAAAYRTVTQRCRFWASATYLTALIAVEKGRFKEAEDLLCKVADPHRSASTTPVFADERFFAVRDLARLGLGRIAHEQGRNDDARYYYYLVPQDSDRLAEALYEAATTRYEKKDYDGARDLLIELSALGVHHRYEDEAGVLGAWIDLALCRFADADAKLAAFIKRYEPVRDAARRLGESDAATARLLASMHAGGDPGGAEVGGMSSDALRALAALLGVDAGYDRVVRRRAALEREASGVDFAVRALSEMQETLATQGGVRPQGEVGLFDDRGADVREALSGVESQMSDLEAAHAPAQQLAPLRAELSALVSKAGAAGALERGAGESPGPANEGAPVPVQANLPDLLRGEAPQVASLRARTALLRRMLGQDESALAKDALRRVDLRLTRLLRRARLGRIESVLGRKRALEVEVEAIRLGYLPNDAVDSLNAARFLQDSEEYWPFEGDDWPDEYVGSEIK